MTPMEMELLKILSDNVKELSAKVSKLEETINKGKGAYIMFIAFLSLLGTGLGLYKILGK